MSSSSRVHLVRHCESSGQAPDAALTARGRKQAELLAVHLAALGIDHIVSSDWRRAVESIEPFAARSGLALRREARLRERVLAAGSLPDWREALERSYRELDHRLPGGETSREARERGRRVLDALGGSGFRRPALVTHGNLLALILGSVDPSLGFAFWRELTNPDVYVLDWPVRGPDSIRRRWPPPSPGGAAGESA